MAPTTVFYAGTCLKLLKNLLLLYQKLLLLQQSWQDVTSAHTY